MLAIWLPGPSLLKRPQELPAPTRCGARYKAQVLRDIFPGWSHHEGGHPSSEPHHNTDMEGCCASASVSLVCRGPHLYPGVFGCTPCLWKDTTDKGNRRGDKIKPSVRSGNWRQCWDSGTHRGAPGLDPKLTSRSANPTGPGPPRLPAETRTSEKPTQARCIGAGLPSRLQLYSAFSSQSTGSVATQEPNRKLSHVCFSLGSPGVPRAPGRPGKQGSPRKACVAVTAAACGPCPLCARGVSW